MVNDMRPSEQKFENINGSLFGDYGSEGELNHEFNDNFLQRLC